MAILSRSRGYLPSANRPFEEEDPLVRDPGISPNSPISSGYNGIHPSQAYYVQDPYTGTYHFGGESKITNPLVNYAQYRAEIPYFEHYGMLGNVYGSAVTESRNVTEGGGRNFFNSPYLGINVSIDHDLALKQATTGSLQNLRQTYYDYNSYTPEFREHTYYNVASNPHYKTTAEKNAAYNAITNPFNLVNNRPGDGPFGPNNTVKAASLEGKYVNYNPSPGYNLSVLDKNYSNLRASQPSSPSVKVQSTVRGASGGTAALYNTNFRPNEKLHWGGIIQGPTYSLRSSLSY